MSDSISRQAVMDALCSGCELFHRNGEQPCLSKCEEYHFLVVLPSTDNKGEWIIDDDGILTCSKCGAHTLFKTNFCYKCGADMRGGTDE